MSYPRISIITPTYNSAKHLKACILSIAQQTYANKEHLIVDNLSTDGSHDIIKKYSDRYQHIRVIKEKDNGIYDAMNITYNGEKMDANMMANFPISSL